MHPHEELVNRFYTAFGYLDHRSMNECYSDEIVFFDPVFGLLEGDEVKAMWEMLCTKAKDFNLKYENIQMLDEEYVTCNWIATYTFSNTGKKVVNRIKAHMRIKDGKIVEHSDAFRVSEWASQALGLKGALFGWTGFMKRKIQKNARESLRKFIEMRNKNG